MPPDLTRLPRAELEAMAAWARIIGDCHAAFAQDGPVTAALLGEPVEEWRHYPGGDVFDPATHAQYFYHLHPPGGRGADEHGHFHTFLRARGMPTGMRPLVLPELAIAGSPDAPTHGPSAPQAQEDGDPWCHLVAVAMNPAGRPIRLFTTNRWVTGETWYRAGDVAAMLDRFAVAETPTSGALDRWISALVGLYRPQIIALLAARDEAVMGWRRRRRGKVHVFEDRRLEVTSSLEIDIAAQRNAVEAALRAASAEAQ
jgi:hypothetical protein